MKSSTKIKLYKSLVKSILEIYSITAEHGQTKRGLTYITEKQLKKILNIRYLKKIRNKSLYRICPKKKCHCHYKSYRLAGVSLVIFYEETKTFLQIKQQELISSLMVTNCDDDQSVKQRSLTDSRPNQTTLK